MDNEDKNSGRVSELVGQSPEALPQPPDRLPRRIYNNFIFEFCNAIMWQSFGSPVIFFIRQSGGSAFIVGFLSTIPLLLMPLTLASSRVIERIGYRRTALTTWTLRWLFCSLLIPIALLDVGVWRVPMAVGVIFLFHLMRNFGVSAWTPWNTLIIPASRRGMYIGRATLFANLASVAAFLAIGAMLGSNPALSQFAWVFLLGAFGGLFSSIFMSRIQPPPRRATVKTSSAAPPRASFWQGVKKCFARPGFANFVVVQSFYGVAFFGIPSLSLIYMREKVGISPNIILYFSTAGVAGATFASIIWGRWVDRRGTTSLQLVAFLGLCVNSLLWFCVGLFGLDIANIALAALVNLLSAVWISALNMSQSHSVMTLAPEEDRVLFQNIATFMTLISQALAPMLWGILLDVLDHNHFSVMIGGLEVGAYRLFFLSSLVLGILGAVFLLRLSRRQLQAEQEVAE